MLLNESLASIKCNDVIYNYHHFRIPLLRHQVRRPWSAIRNKLEAKYGTRGMSNSVGEVPEPLTNYLDVRAIV